ncbi:hypothetical protein E2C01_051669 [Portunus trituberculatus]|uniref:Uncharacterized protein n=1 Tax=Portunus trituberculatus TaxID=210409 RepID=A0A5B7GFI0_PORTR|nr:hypothetical protein [Portunus trituberculatus]
MDHAKPSANPSSLRPSANPSSLRPSANPSEIVLIQRLSSPLPQTGVCRLRQFSVTSRGGVVNRGDSFRPRRSASNTSVTSTVSSCSRERLPR